MSIKHFVYLLALALSLPFGSTAQTLDTLPGNPGKSFRGLSVLNDRFFWVSGNKGTVGRSTDGGKTIKWMTVKGYETRDFRDIEGFDAVTAVVIAVDSPGLILRTYDGGASWEEVYRNNEKGIFMDAMDFHKDREGMVIGDPLNGQIFLLRTDDEGRHWHAMPGQLPAPAEGEACFASSGSNIKMLGKTSFTFITGGTQSRVWVDNRLERLPLLDGGNSTGANAIAVKGKRWIVVGGDFTRDTLAQGHIAVSRDRGRTWTVPSTPTTGYRSGVAAITKKKWIACGTSGVDVSSDGGRTWRRISTTGYHVVQRAKKGRAVYLAGGNGHVARLNW
ncbi:WD40/YVTN/BNR-like repeat-containing protein [Flavihumibacter petaseus]|uniref:Photosynthesis system II assembly factor Ycf48/Hcf136-like domain-containing protein n=1 Tax=Flavihumibacter petaseus NBRC 106054 TaxID=1220578 RepID=A0A0E9N5X4_9BACT|nr:YCF48-related protein [Flavihumibacter petaseus]GAO44745.1 hypothetical protein FPE01S_03_07850 [Flavihumibacter petaseus NBRC 106054]